MNLEKKEKELSVNQNNKKLFHLFSTFPTTKTKKKSDKTGRFQIGEHCYIPPYPVKCLQLEYFIAHLKKMEYSIISTQLKAIQNDDVYINI